MSQALKLLRTHEIGCLFTTPKLFEAQAAQDLLAPFSRLTQSVTVGVY